jgi:hypothetical protein
MQKRTGFTIKTATNYIQNRYELISEEEIKTVLEKNPGFLNLSGEGLVEAFIQAYKQLLQKEIPVETSASSSSEDEEDSFDAKAFNTWLQKADLKLSEEILEYLAQQFKLTVRRLNEGSLCCRWVLLNKTQKSEVLERLFEGTVAVIVHFVSNYVEIENKQIKGGLAALKKALEGRTIIIHGSYLFGPRNYVPKDMDVIIEGSTAKSAESIRLSRDLLNGKLTIGQRYGAIDLLVGIAIWGGADIREIAWKDVVGDLKDYCKSAIIEEDAGKKYRKLVNIAIIIVHFKDEEKLQKLIERANQSIVGSNPGNQDTEQLQVLCSHLLGLDK